MILNVILTIIILLLLGFVFYLILKKNNKSEDKNSMSLLQQHILDIGKTLDSKLSETNKNIEDKLSNSNKTLDEKLRESGKILSENMAKTFATNTKISQDSIKNTEELTKKITQLQEETKQIKDIWWQLKWLENILKNPKQRWNLWEYFLRELLENVFSEDQYKLQYTIEWVWIVDAVLFIWWKIIPIDVKFPQENYERLISSENDHEIDTYSKLLKTDIWNRIKETSKYIVPEKNTTDFAFMLIPAEWLYYDIFINKVWNIKPKELIEHAFKKKVIVCSPSSFYAYLQTVLQWMKALQIEEQAKEIQKYVVKLQKDLKNYEELFEKLWSSLGATVNHYNNASKRFQIIDKDIVKITDGEAGWDIELLQIEKPDN